MDKESIIKALRDGAQATSNGIAKSVVGDPVDQLANGLRYVGLPIGNSPVMGSDWMRQQGIIKQVPDNMVTNAADVLGQTAGNLAYLPGQVAGIVGKAIK